jgi:hypothetical protein
MNNELKWMWKDVVIALFDILSYCLLTEADRNFEKLQL